MKISKKQLRRIIKEELTKESSDPVGPQEAQKVAELLQNLGFTLTRGGLNSLIDFMQGLEQSGDLNASPDSRRGALAEAEESPEMHDDETKTILKDLVNNMQNKFNVSEEDALEAISKMLRYMEK